MRSPCLRLLIACSLVAGAIDSNAEQNLLRPAEAVRLGDSPLDLGSHAIPCAVDWDNDGLTDLVVGYRTADKVALLLNSGTVDAPVFTVATDIQADGADIVHPSTGCGAPAPWVCDYDNDGRKDLLVGTGLAGHVYLYENTGADEAPVLTNAGPLTVADGPLDVGVRATPCVYDWDGDGLQDLLCGDGDGYAHVFRNEGAAGSPLYSTDVLIHAGGTPVNFGARSAVRVCDWDGDGVADLLGSGSYSVSWCRNIGSNTAPVLESPSRLYAPTPTGGLTEIDTGYRMRLDVVDWSRDGTSDLLIGDDGGTVFIYEAYEFVLSGIVVDGNGATLRWASADYLDYDVLAGGHPGVLTTVSVGIPSDGDTTSWTAPPGADAEFYRVTVSSE